MEKKKKTEDTKEDFKGRFRQVDSLKNKLWKGRSVKGGTNKLY